MQTDKDMSPNLTSKSFMEAMILLSLIAFLAMLCLRVFTPFAGLVIWGLVLAIMLYPLHQRVATRMGGRQGYAATLIVLLGIMLIGLPLIKLGSITVTEIQDLKVSLENNTLEVRPANPGVAEWPVVGEQLYEVWNQAATNLSAFMEKYEPQLRDLSIKAFSKIASIFLSGLSFVGALAVAGIMMAWAKPGSAAMLRIISRIVGPVKGPRINRLSVATVRSVATGVLGVAFIQALLFGIGFMFAGVPAAAPLALVVMLLGIMQLPAILVAVPVIIYVWSTGDFSVTINIVFTVYFLVAGLCDNVLKPMLLGRGVEAPMPVILIGAMGGMVTGGFIGLFLGAILLAVGYQIFMDWVNEGRDPSTEEPTQVESSGEAAPSGE